MSYNKVIISSGHSINCQGASDIINEVDEAIKVVDRVSEIIGQAGKECYKYHDTASSSNTNLSNIVNFHNKYSDGVDVSVHFNCVAGRREEGIGVEVLYYSSTKGLAEQMSENISKVSGLINRGAKQRTGLYFLKNTKKPSILIEVCFVNSVKDVEIYKSKFEDICKIIAETLVGEIKVQDNSTQNNSIQNTTTKKEEAVVKGDPWVRSLQEECNKQGFSNQVIDGIAGKNTLAGLPVLKQGAKGNITKLLQEKLTALGFSTNGADGIFGNWTRTAVIKYQKSKGLIADGIVGQATWKSILNL